MKYRRGLPSKLLTARSIRESKHSLDSGNLWDQRRAADGFWWASLIGVLAFWTMLGAGAVAFADNGVGSWLSQSGNNWPLIPIHATLTPDGRVVTYGTKTGSTSITMSGIRRLDSLADTSRCPIKPRQTSFAVRKSCCLRAATSFWPAAGF